MVDRETNANRLCGALGPAVAFAAFAVYVYTLSVGVYPGESAGLAATHIGLIPRMSPAYPLWGGMAWLIAHVPVGPLALRLNLFSALCGAAAVWLLYTVMVRTVSAAVKTARVGTGVVKRVAHLSGLASALALAFCIPFWAVSNRVHTASFDILLIVLASLLLVKYMLSGRERTALLFAFVFGLGMVEFATFIILAPLAGLALLLLMWRQEQLRWGLVIKLLLATLGGLLLYGIAVWAFCLSDGYVLREFESPWRVLWIMWRDQYLLITRSLPREGWLLILLFTVVPWLVALTVAHRALNGEGDWSFVLLHLVMTGLAVGVVLNVKLAPWPLLGFSRILVTPYLLTAILFGYLTAYWYLLPMSHWGESESPAKRRSAGAAGSVLALALLGLAGFAAVRNVREADARDSAFVKLYVDETLDAVGDRQWLATDGAIDDSLLLAAAQRKQPLHVINLRAGGNEVYLRYLQQEFTEPRLKTMATVGVMPLLQEWIATDPAIEDKLAIMSAPDLWLGAGFSAVPQGLVFTGSRAADESGQLKLLVEHEKLWSELVPALKHGVARGGHLAGLADECLRHVSLVANNLGVVLDDHGKPDEARVAYTKARECYPGNISALLNLALVARQNASEEDLAAIEKDLDTVMSGLKTRPQIWSLARYYGYVRSASVFADLGMSWALSGQPGLAVAGMKKALALSSAEKSGQIREGLAGLHLMQGQDEASAALYYELLVEDPDNQNALVGLGRISMRRNDLEEAEKFFQSAERAGVPKTDMALEWASLHMAAGETAEARIILEEAVDVQPDGMRAWSMLIEVLSAPHDADDLRALLKRLSSVEHTDLLQLDVKARLALQDQDAGHAMAYYEQALKLAPGNMALMEKVTGLALASGRNQEALLQARQILAVDPGSALGNYVVGSRQIEDGQYEMATDSLSRSVARKASAAACNDLAWLFQREAKYEEAEQYVRQALEIDQSVYACWDTLGCILMLTGRLTESETAFRKALSLYQDDPAVFLHLAELHLMQGDTKRAGDLAGMLVEKRGQFSDSDAQRFSDLQRKLRAK